ncbi:SWIB/MDM2 domain-containing protein [Arthroderma uncinatum]|uniref:SWIB/MDM2 domain-containing protein n=1 Tax=Arthroderma uncinatum TaxID=74035 RepID=UPI00144A98FC|nr:SWIB/MDM2 domain-containing protein [Arthroderma uncinatum]KAF3483747.1 SWIB/MDM2 domain-containing protein [Arthroderma uncinatum]
MSAVMMELSPDARASYTAIIDSILASSDLTTISEKRIRRGLQETTGDDLAPYKSAVKELIMERFDMFAEQSNVATAEPEPSKPVANGHGCSSPSPPQKRSADPEGVPEITDSSPPPVKKRKDDVVDSDAAFAAKLQAEENLRARTTRGANSRKTGVTKKKRKSTSKTAKRVKASDDSDVDGSGVENKKEVNRTGGFHKPMALSPALSTLLGGQVTLSRPQTVKKVWEYIRENELQDPADRRQIRCDGLMRPVFKQDRIHMFTMTKILNQNLYDPEE